MKLGLNQTAWTERRRCWKWKINGRLVVSVRLGLLAVIDQRRERSLSGRCTRRPASVFIDDLLCSSRASDASDRWWL